MELKVPWICTPSDPETKTKSANEGTRRDVCRGDCHLLDVVREGLQLRENAPSTAIESLISCAYENQPTQSTPLAQKLNIITVTFLRRCNSYWYAIRGLSAAISGRLSPRAITSASSRNQRGTSSQSSWFGKINTRGK